MDKQIETERALLSALAERPDGLVQYGDLICEESFVNIASKAVYNALQSLLAKGDKIDLVTIANEVRDLEAHEVVEVLNGVYQTGATKQYCLILLEARIARGQRKLAVEIIKRVEANADALDTNQFLVDEVYDLANIENIAQEPTTSEIVQELNDKMESAKNKQLTGVGIGLVEVDRIFGGYQDGDLIILAARPAMGKTALALRQALHAAMDGKHVPFFSLEMSAVQLMMRLVSIHSGIPLENLKKNDLTDEQCHQYNESTAAIIASGIKIIDNCFTLSSITLKARKLAAKGELDMIVIDYLQLIHGKKGAVREQEISHISRTIKQTGMELKVPVVALSQLSRAVESRTDRRPILSDLRESGAIEQDADIVQFLYRPEYYGLTQNEDGQSTEGLAYNIVAKHRNGSTGDIPLRFIAEQTRFEDYIVQPFSPANFN